MGKEEEEEEWFKRGAEVEVSFNEQGFRGSWYTGTVLRTVSKKNNKIFIEFHTLKADDKKAFKPLRQFVDLVDVRPLAPRELTRSFNLSDLVDAFHNDGWWEGTVTDVIHHHHHHHNSNYSTSSSSSSTYSVFFRSSREQIEFHESDLRLHREWDHGNWKPQLEPQPSNHQHHHHHDDNKLPPRVIISYPQQESTQSFSLILDEQCPPLLVLC